MTQHSSRRGATLAAFAVGLLVVLPAAPVRAAAQDPPIRILLDQSPRAIDYQLARLSDDRLACVERRADDPRYVPVYYALLTRPGLDQQLRDEAMDALTSLERVTRSAVLLNALGRIAASDDSAAAPVTRMLLAEPSAELAKGRASFDVVLSDAAASPFALRAAYGARLLADDSTEPLWTEAAARPGHRVRLLESVRFLPVNPATEGVRRQLVPLVQSIASDGPETQEQVAAIHALVALRPDAATFLLLGTHLTTVRDPAVSMAAIRGMSSVPEKTWPVSSLSPLVRALLDRVTQIAPDARTEPDAIDAIQLAERLTAMLPATDAPAARAELRALGVRVVRIEALVEQVSFDLRWFAVEAGKPVQIVFVNPDAMPHNVVVGAPGSLETLGNLGGAMPMPSDPKARPFVPDVPEVLQATRLIKQGETERLGFVAPQTAGEYVFVCTFPGHWTRMYGVMLVVPNLEAWEAARTVPTDPMTRQPFSSERH